MKHNSLRIFLQFLGLVAVVAAMTAVLVSCGNDPSKPSRLTATKVSEIAKEDVLVSMMKESGIYVPLQHGDDQYVDFAMDQCDNIRKYGFSEAMEVISSAASETEFWSSSEARQFIVIAHEVYCPNP